MLKIQNMKIIKIRSKSNPKIFRSVQVLESLGGGVNYKCDCPANTWWRISNGRRGKAICRHIQAILDKREK